MGFSKLGASVALFCAFFITQLSAGETTPLSHLLTQVRDVRGDAVKPSAQAKGWVVVFMGTQCRLVRNYLPTLETLSKVWGAQGVTLMGVFSHAHETVAQVAAFAREKNPSFLMVHDSEQAIAKALHAEKTPESYVLGSDFRILYRGRIDDQHGLLSSIPAARHLYLADAVKATLEGAFPPHSVTDVEGCFINLKKAFHEPTFTEDIGPLVYNKCATCHRDKEVAGELFKFTSFDEIAPNAATIAGVTEERIMPPWRAGTLGTFQNNFSLDANEIWKLRRWNKNGTPRGPGELPVAPPAPKEGFRQGTPDAIIHMVPEDNLYRVPPKSEKAVMPYQYFRVKTNFDEDKWLIASEIQALVPQVVHHVTVFLVMPKIDDEWILKNPRAFRIAKYHAFKKYGVTPENFEWGFRLYGRGMRRQLQLIATFSPTEPTRLMPKGFGFLIPKGAELVFECHYTPTDTEKFDRTAVGLWFAKSVPENPTHKQVITRSGGFMSEIQIPANGKLTLDHKINFHADAKLFNLRPHMHQRGKKFTGVLEYPDGKKQTLLHIPDWDFNWQMPYDFASPVSIPKGSVLHSIYEWDNTDRPNNPDPTKEIRFGQQFDDEMCLSYPTYVYDRPEEMKNAEIQLESDLQFKQETPEE